MCAPITTPEYWEASWQGSDVPDAIDPELATPENRLYRALHAVFSRVLGARVPRGARLIEIGCGASRWLPYFHRTFGYEVAGIDYSPAGIHLAKRILDRQGISADVVHGDLFSPPPSMLERFDVVASFGVVEHFDRTASAVSACARYLRPGGTMITAVPTMTGPYGLAYRLARPSIYLAHVPQSRDSLAKAHADAALDVIECRYVLGLPTMLTRPAAGARAWRRAAFMLSAGYVWLEQRKLGVPPNRWTSPYALCIATKPRSSVAEGA